MFKRILFTNNNLRNFSFHACKSSSPFLSPKQKYGSESDNKKTFSNGSSEARQNLTLEDFDKIYDKTKQKFRCKLRLFGKLRKTIISNSNGK